MRSNRLGAARGLRTLWPERPMPNGFLAWRLFTAGVLDAIVVHVDERPREALFDDSKVIQRQVAFVQLAVQEPLQDLVVHHGAEAGWIGLLLRLRDRFDHVPQHEDPRLAKSRLGTRIAVLDGSLG